MDKQTKMDTCKHHAAGHEKDFCAFLNKWYDKSSWRLWTECEFCKHYDPIDTQSPEPQKNPPSEKQISFANAISSELGIGLPKEKTKQSLFLFIQEHRPAYDKRMLERKRSVDKSNYGYHWHEGSADIEQDDADYAEAEGVGFMGIGW